MASETGGSGEHEGIPACMWAPALVLLILGMTLASWPVVRSEVQDEADRFHGGSAYQSVVLDNQPVPPRLFSPICIPRLSWKQPTALAATLLLAWLTLFPSSVGPRANKRLGHWIARGMGKIRPFQSGRIGDYVAWIVFGTAIYGALLLIFRRNA